MIRSPVGKKKKNKPITTHCYLSSGMKIQMFCKWELETYAVGFSYMLNLVHLISSKPLVANIKLKEFCLFGIRIRSQFCWCVNCYLNSAFFYSLGHYWAESLLTYSSFPRTVSSTIPISRCHELTEQNLV